MYVPCIVSLETWTKLLLTHKQEHDTTNLDKKEQGAVVGSGKLPCHLSDKLPEASDKKTVSKI